MYVDRGGIQFRTNRLRKLVAQGASSFRTAFFERMALLGDLSAVGSLGRVARLLHEVWSTNDIVDAEAHLAGTAAGLQDASTMSQRTIQQDVHWRDVMQQNGWDWLLI